VPSPAPSFRVGVLVSGEGSNLQALLDTVHGRGGVEIVAVGASRSDARGLERGRRAGVETASFPIADHDDRAARDRAMGDWLEEQRVDLVVLAGFMELLGPEFVGRFRGRMINVHPALLPAFPGVRAIERAFDHGVKVTGVTVHFVDEGIDSGPIILQEAFELPYSRGVAEIEKGIHEIEHRLLPRAVSLIAEGRVRLDEHNPRLVRIEQPDGGTD
jgi:phosphoribosylglycinamide formyltransferase-1